MTAWPVPRRSACNTQETGSSFNTSRTWSPPCPYTTWIAAGSSSLAVSMTCFSNGRPASGCRTFGSADIMRLPWPAARMTRRKGCNAARRGRGGFFSHSRTSLAHGGGGGRDLPLDDHSVRVLVVLATVLQLRKLFPDSRPYVELGIGVFQVLGGLAVLDEVGGLLERLFERGGRGNRVLKERFPEVREVAVILTAQGAVLESEAVAIKVKSVSSGSRKRRSSMPTR